MLRSLLMADAKSKDPLHSGVLLWHFQQTLLVSCSLKHRSELKQLHCRRLLLASILRIRLPDSIKRCMKAQSAR